jgi:hypothetical protein
MLLGIRGVKGTTQDCVEFYDVWKHPDNAPIDVALIHCSDEGICENLYWRDDFVSFGVIQSGYEITCDSAATLKSQAPEIEWFDIERGPEIASVLMAIEEVLEVELLDDLDWSPFHVVRDTGEAIPKLEQLITDLTDLVEDNPDCEKIERAINDNFPMIKVWGSAVASLSAITFNLPADVTIHERTLEWNDEMIRMYRRFAKLVFHNMDVYSADSDDQEEWETVSEGSLGERTGQDLVELWLAERAVQSRVKRDIDRVVDGDASDWVSVMERAKDTGMCHRVNEFIALAVHEASEVSEKQIVMDFARECRILLTFVTRMSVLSGVMLRWVPDLSPHLPQARAVVSSQLLTFEESLELLGNRDRFMDDLPKMQLWLQDSAAEGFGPVYAFVSQTLEQALKSDLFMPLDSRGVLIKPVGGDNRRKHALRAVGRLIGLAIAHQVPIFFPLGRIGLSMITGRSMSAMMDLISDLEADDPDTIRALTNLRLLSEDELVEAGLVFEDGSEVVVTREKLEEYINQQIYRMHVEPIEEPMIRIIRGIYDVIPFGHLSWLTPKELSEVLTAGAREVDVTELKAATNVAVEYENHQEIEWFWEVMKEFSQEELRDVLQFVSGSKYLPIEGVTHSWIGIVVNEDQDLRDTLPKAQLCFRQLKLPKYSSKEVMKRMLKIAITFCGSVDTH